MSEPTPPSPRRRRRRFRWYTRLAIVLGCVVVVTLAIAQALFWSDYPRRIVQAQIGSILHVDAKLGGLRIGWLGGVDVRDLSLQLPTEDQPFLTVATAHLKLAPLFVIAFDQEVRDVQASGVDVALRQQPTGRWNLQQLLASAAGPSPTPSEPTNPAKLLATLPSVRLTGVRVSATKNDGKSLVLPDVRLTLGRDAPLTTTIDAHVGPEVSVAGRVATLGTAPHELAVTITNPPPGLAEFLGAALPTPANAALTWTGRLTPGGITGTLSLDSVAVDVARVHGSLDVTAGGKDGGVTVRPTDLRIAVAQAFLPVSDGTPSTALTLRQTQAGMPVPLQSTTQPTELAIRVTSGAIRYDDRLHVDALRGTVNGGGRFAVDGQADLTTFAADFRAAWDDVAQADVATTGHATLTTTPQFTGKLRVAAGVGASARLPGGAASGTVALTGEGDAIDAFDGTLTIEPLTWTPAKGDAIVTPPLVGDVASRGTELSLRDLHSTDSTIGTLAASGAFDRATQAWWTTFDARELKLPPLEALGARFPIDADASAFGTRGEHATIQQIYARSGPAMLWSSGLFERDRPRPVRLETWAWLDRPETDDAQAHLNSLTAVGIVEGTLEPRAIDADMQVKASQLAVHGRAVGDIAMQIVAHATEDHATLQSREMDLLGGTWQLNGLWDRDSDQPPTATLDFRRLPLARLGDVAKLGGIGGTIDEGHVIVRLGATALDKIDVQATASGSDLAYGAAPQNGTAPSGARLTADTLTLAASLRDGRFRAVPILRSGEGTLTAQLDGDVTLKEPVRLHATLENWPSPEAAPSATQPTTLAAATTATTMPSTLARASATIDAQATLGDGPIRGALTMRAAVDRGEARLADVAVDATADGPLLTLRDATVHTLDGTLRASGHVDARQPNGATFDAKFDRLAPSELAWLAPPLADLAGRFSGTAAIGTASVSRPLGPVQITLAVRPEAAHFRSVDVGDIDVRAFATFDAADRFRIVTDTATVHVAGGTVMPFGRLSRDPTTGFAQLVTVTFDQLDIGQLTKAFDDDGKDLVGKLAGTVQVYGATKNLATISGDATAHLTDSDLANFGPVSALYNLLNIGTAGKKPDGTGDFSARLEEGVLTLTDATYFNRGVYATAFGTVRKVDELPQSPLDLTVIGSLQPLRSSNPSFFADIFNTANDTFAALQTSLTAIHAGGTLKDPAVGQVGLNALGSGVQALLLGKVKEQPK